MIAVFKIAVFFLIIYFFGWQFTRRALKQSELYLLIPVAPVFGLAAYVLAINGLGYLFPAEIAFPLALSLLAAAGFAFLALPVKNALRLGLDKKIFKRLLIINIIIFFFYLPPLFTLYSWDEDWHGPLIATIANGNLPPVSPFVPGVPIEYHYAFDLAAAGIARLGANPFIASSLVMAFLAFWLFGLAFAAINKLIKRPGAALFSAWLLLFGGGLRYLAVFYNIDCSGQYLWDYFKQISDHLLTTNVVYDNYFHPFSADTLGVFLYRRTSLFAALIGLAALWLIYLEERRPGWPARLSLALLFGLLALAEETFFAVFFGGWCVWKIIGLFKNRKIKIVFLNKLRNFLIIAGLACLLALVQGGVATNIFKGLLFSGSGGAHAFSFRFMPGITSYGGFYPVSQSFTWLFAAVEWGLPLLVLPWAIIYAFKLKNRYLSLLITILAVSLFFALFFEYRTQPREWARLNAYGIWLMGILAGLYLYDKYKAGGWWKKIVVSFIILMAISPVGYTLRKWPARAFIPDIIAETKDLQAEKIVAEEAKKIIPKKAAILTAAPLTVSQLWGNIVYFGAPDRLDVLMRSLDVNLYALLAREDLYDYLKNRGVFYIYVNPEFMPYEDKLDKNKIKKIYNYEEKYAIYEIL